MSTIDPNFGSDYSEGLGGRDNLGGLQQTFWLAPKVWFQTIAPADAYPNDSSFTGTLAQIKQTISISGDHVFQTGKGFLPVYCTFDTSKLEQAKNETIDKTGKAINFTAFYPGDDENVLALFSMIENFDCIVLAKALDASPSAPYYQIGEANLFARVMGNFSTSNTTGDRKGISIDVKSYQARIKLYKGLVTLHP